jgi:opacity protein-like surface antigen
MNPLRLSYLSVFAGVFLSASSALAGEGTGAFEGPYVSVGAGFEGSRIYDQTVRAPGLGLMYKQQNTADKHAAAQVLAGYGIDFNPNITLSPEWSFSPKFNLSANIFHNFSNKKVGFSYATFYSDTVVQKLSNNLGIALEPGYYINDRLLAYGKMGYVRADALYRRDNFTISQNNSIDGYLFGAGAKYLLTDHIYVGADVTRYDYGRSSLNTHLGGIDVIVSSKIKQTTGLISVGYQF